MPQWILVIRLFTANLAAHLWVCFPLSIAAGPGCVGMSLLVWFISRFLLSPLEHSSWPLDNMEIHIFCPSWAATSPGPLNVQWSWPSWPLPAFLALQGPISQPFPSLTPLSPLAFFFLLSLFFLVEIQLIYSIVFQMHRVVAWWFCRLYSIIDYHTIMHFIPCAMQYI